ncbi:MAG: hypothetical protein ACXVB0_17345 [Mucilaginibacter sp.]
MSKDDGKSEEVKGERSKAKGILKAEVGSQMSNSPHPQPRTPPQKKNVKRQTYNIQPKKWKYTITPT